MKNRRKILFRVDAGGRVGLGHFYRSCHLAMVLKNLDYEVVFTHEKSNFWDDIKNFEFQHYELCSDNSCRNMVDFCLQNEFGIIYVDGILEFDELEIFRLQLKTKIVFYQNISESRHLADIYILPSIHQEAPFFLNFDTKKTQIFQGLEYFLGNSEINKLTAKNIDSAGNVSQIGIITGGSDPGNVMLAIFKLIDFEKWSSVIFNFYYGNDYMWLGSFPDTFEKNVSLLPYDLSDICENDILITSFGVSAYEFLALGMPVLSTGHQIANARALRIFKEKTNAIYDLGLIDKLDSESLNNAIQKYVNDMYAVQLLSNAARRTIDLKGVDRIVAVIEGI